MSLIVANFDNYLHDFYPHFQYKIEKKEESEDEEEDDEDEDAFNKKKDIPDDPMAGMINLQGVQFNKTPPSEMSHPILLKVICDRIWNREKYFKIATFWNFI